MVKAARALGLPTLMLVWSWDNLSSKAVLHEHPDRLLVWNETQAREAEELQGVAPERVEVVGAPNFDRFFAAVEAAGDRRSGEHDRLPRLLDERRPGRAVDLRPLARCRTGRAEPSRRRGASSARTRPGRPGSTGRRPSRASRCSGRRQKVETERARRAARPGRRRRRPEHERRDRGGDRRPAGADVPRRRGRARPGRLDPLRLPARAERRLRARRSHARRTTSRGSPGARRAPTTPAPLERFVEHFVRPRGIDEPVAPIVAAAALELVGAQPTPLGGAA